MAERAANLELLHDFSLSIDGELVSAGEIMEVIDPATEAIFAACPAAGREHLDPSGCGCPGAPRATGADGRTKSARNSSGGIPSSCASAKTNSARSSRGSRASPIGQSVAEFERGTAQADGMAGIEIAVEVLIEDAKQRIELHYRPLGVVGIITPWNAPAALALGRAQRCALHREHRHPQAVAVYAVDDAEDGRIGASHLSAGSR